MNQEVFKNYQRILSKEREQYLQETKKLAPKPIVLDTDFDEVLEQASIDEYIMQINRTIKRMYMVDEFTFTVEELSAASLKLANAFKLTKEEDILSI